MGGTSRPAVEIVYQCTRCGEDRSVIYEFRPGVYLCEKCAVMEISSGGYSKLSEDDIINHRVKCSQCGTDKSDWYVVDISGSVSCLDCISCDDEELHVLFEMARLTNS